MPWMTVQIPLRRDVVLVAICVATNAYFSFSGYAMLEQFAFSPDPLRQFLRYFADRQGILAFGSTPLVILLAARNSPISWLTGASFSTLQIYHRWVARVTFANVFLHCAAYTYLLLRESNSSFWSLFEATYLRWGWAAFFGGVVLTFAAWRNLRHIAYEAFLVGHICGALAWIGGSYLHVLYLSGQYTQLRWVYWAAAAWAFDRILRLASLLWNNSPLHRFFPLSCPSLSRRSRSTAKGSLVAAGDFIRLRITPARRWPANVGRPGSYIFISSPRHNIGQSHPFSIAWPLCMPSAPSSGNSSPTLLDGDGLLNRRDDELDAYDDDCLELVIKRYGGFTRALAESLDMALPVLLALTAAEQGTPSSSDVRDLPILVEGPYGHVVSYEDFETVVLVAGGSGIAMVTSQLADMVLREQECKLKTNKVVVIWSVREPETVHLLLPYLDRLHTLFTSSPSFSSSRLCPPAQHPFIDLHIYLTGHPTTPSHSTPSPPNPPSCAAPPLVPRRSNLPPPSQPLPLLKHTPASLPHGGGGGGGGDGPDPLESVRALFPRAWSSLVRLSTHEGRRPDIGSHLDGFLLRRNTAAAAGGEDGRGTDARSMVVASCGPAGLCDAAREAVRARLSCGSGWGRGWRRKGRSCGEGERERLLLGSSGAKRDGRDEVLEACRLVYSEEAILW
ncbi:hypothetical protein JCM5296_005244 [Sporobolomyces johnsonii]